MENGIIILSNKLSEIYNLYENHIWRHNNCKLNILIEDAKIDISISDELDIIDRYAINFNNQETSIYRYLVLTLFNTALGYVVIHQNNNTFSNLIHKPYLSFIVNDEAILNIVEEMIYNQNKMHIHEAIENMYPELPYSPLKEDAWTLFEKRTELTKKRLRGLNI